MHNDGFNPPVHYLDKEDEEVHKEEIMPHAWHVIQQKESYRMKVDLPTFNGVVDMEQFLDRIYEVVCFFYIMNVDP